ncbi:hypothetical protein [Streptomyces sp. NPDC059209]|uniref:hypothetical protein n=1 Tax=Streptomyces sp. NPDC059209 TaxID=3346769 RepID=UPI0036BB7496
MTTTENYRRNTPPANKRQPNLLFAAARHIGSRQERVASSARRTGPGRILVFRSREPF